MVSRQETARQLLTPGEIMQLPPDDEIVMIAGVPPIRAKKVRYFEDRRLSERLLPPASPAQTRLQSKADDWSKLTQVQPIAIAKTSEDLGRADAPASGTSAYDEADGDPANAGLRREPGLERHKNIAPEPLTALVNEFELDREETDDAAARVRMGARNMRWVARQAAMDPRDGIEL